MFRIAVLVSGGGTNLQSIIDKTKENGFIEEVKIDIVIADRECYGITRAQKENIESYIVNRNNHKKDLSQVVDKVLSEKQIDLIVLAGFLSILSEDFVKKWKKKIINIHPSLLPKFGGKGMFGLNVHRAVINSGESESGCTVHYVDAGVDSGEIINQKKVEVLRDDTPLTLQKKILAEEHILLLETIDMIIKRMREEKKWGEH